jgi:hypothetical protein
MKYAALVAVALFPAAMMAQTLPPPLHLPPPPATTKVSIHVECVGTSPTAAYIMISVDPWTAVAYSKSKDEFDWEVDAKTDPSISVTIFPNDSHGWPYKDKGGSFGGLTKKHHSGNMSSPTPGPHGYRVHAECIIGSTSVAGDLDPDVTIDPAGGITIMNKPGPKRVLK